jgi:ribosome maturation factor RimP
MGTAPIFYLWLMDLHTLLETTIAGLGYELVDLEQSPRARILRLFIDRLDQARGVDIEDCVTVSNHLTRVLTVENIDYDRLEVSSPGLDRPVKKAADFERFAGQEITLKLRIPLNNRRNFQGVLGGMREGKVILGLDTGEVELDLANIEKARLVPKF